MNNNKVETLTKLILENNEYIESLKYNEYQHLILLIVKKFIPFELVLKLNRELKCIFNFHKIKKNPYIVIENSKNFISSQK